MAAAISNLTTPSMKTQTSTPATINGGKSLFDLLGITPGMGIGGKPLFPSTTTQQKAPTTAAPATGLMSTSKPTATTTAAKTAIPAGVAGYYHDQPIYSNQDIAAQMAAIDKSRSGTQTTTPTSTVKGGGLLTAPTAPTTPTKGLFETIAGSLANPQSTKETQQAMKAYERAVTDLRKFEESVADTRKGIFSEGTSARVMQGRDAAVQQANAETRAALQGAVQQQQSAIQYGQTQQSLNQGAMQAIAGLISPQTAAYGQTVFNPLTGTFTGGSGQLDPGVAAGDLAQKVISGQMTYDQAVSSLGYAGGAGQQFLNNAIKAINPGYNIPLGQAGISGQQQVFGQLPQLQAAETAAEGIKGKIVTYLAANPQLNPSALAAGNTLTQWIQGKQLTDPKYQTLFNYLNEYTSTLAPILGVGGDPTNLKTQIAQSFINAAASGQSIATVLDNMSALARGKIQDIQSGATGGGVVSSPISGSGTGSGGLYDW